MKKRVNILLTGILLAAVIGFAGCGPSYNLYKLHGRVYDIFSNPISGVLINFSGGYGSILTDSQGYWEREQLEGLVIVTPTKPEYSFQPSYATVTYTGPLQKVDFTGTQIYSISGRVTDEYGSGISNVLISFSGGFSPTTTSSGGFWTKNGLFSRVDVTPTKEGWEFTPIYKTVIGAQYLVFIGTSTLPPTYSIRGTIRDGYSQAISGVTVRAQGFGTDITDVNGKWGIDGLFGTVTVTPEKSGWTFKPASAQVSESTPDISKMFMDFVGTYYTPELKNIIITPSSGWSIKYGESIKFTARGYDQFGIEMAINPAWAFSVLVYGDEFSNTIGPTITYTRKASLSTAMSLSLMARAKDSIFAPTIEGITTGTLLP